MTLPRFFLSAVLAVLLILCSINWPGITLAVLCIGGSIAALAGGMWLGQCAWEAKEYQDEHDLK